MRIELVNGQYRMMPGAANGACESSPSGKLVTPLAPSLPVQKKIDEDRIEIEGLSVGRAVQVDRQAAAHRGGVDERLIAGTVDKAPDLPQAGQRNGLLDRTYFVQGPQLAAFNASQVGNTVDVRV